MYKYTYPCMYILEYTASHTWTLTDSWRPRNACYACSRRRARHSRYTLEWLLLTDLRPLPSRTEPLNPQLCILCTSPSCGPIESTGTLIYTYMDEYICTYICRCVCIDTYFHVYTCIYMYIYTCVYIYIYIYMYVYIYMYGYIYAYI